MGLVNTSQISPTELNELATELTYHADKGLNSSACLYCSLCFSQGTINACKELNSRLDTIREQIPGLEWGDLIQMCSDAGVNLSARAL